MILLEIKTLLRNFKACTLARFLTKKRSVPAERPKKTQPLAGKLEHSVTQTDEALLNRNDGSTHWVLSGIKWRGRARWHADI